MNHTVKTARACRSGICKGDVGVQEFLQAVAGRFAEIEAFDQCMVGVAPADEEKIETARIIDRGDGRKQVAVGGKGVPMILVTIIGQVVVENPAVSRNRTGEQ